MATDKISPLNIIVVEDYDILRDGLVDLLRADGHQVIGVPMAEDVDDLITVNAPDLFIIDLHLPGEDGISLAQRIRNGRPEVTIVIASARNQLTDRVASYEAGANIYLSKPLAIEELQAIVTSISRRLVTHTLVSKNCGFLNLLKMQLKGPSRSVQLIPAEVSLLNALASTTQNVLEHWQVANHLFGDQEVSKSNLEVKLGRLRKKMILSGLEEPAIQAIRGHGYKLCCSIKTS